MFLSLAGVCFLATFEAKRAYESLNGIMLALASCLGLAFCQVWTKDVVRGGFTREGALLCRLPLLILSFGIWCYAKHTFTTEVPLLWLIIVSLVGLAIPLYLVVYAFERLDVKDVSLAFFLIPVFAFFGSYFTGQFGSNLSLISYAIAGTVVVAGILWSERA
jgi:drug/metabolite transporter (DMT)-like permease